MEKLKCLNCNEVKPINEMCKHSGLKNGYQKLCKQCRSKRRYSNGEYDRERIRKHSIRNGKPEYYTMDGIEKLMNETHCTYCGEEMNRISGDAKQATLDHVYLGVNITDNLVACHRSCNTSKGQDHVYDYYKRSEKFTDELWNKFVYKFASRILNREPFPYEVSAFSQGFADEAAENKALRWE